MGRTLLGRRSPSPSPHENSWGRLSRWVDYDGNSHACLADQPEQIRKTAGRDCVKAASLRGASFPVQTPDPVTQG